MSESIEAAALVAAIEATAKIELPPLPLIWGASAIAKVIGKTGNATYLALQRGRLPAKKVGGQWVADHDELRRFLTNDTGGK